MKPNIDRFRRDIQALAQIGRTPEGGVSRFALTPEDIKGRELTMGLMKEAGLSARVDAVGNIRARREGKDPTLPLVMMGSHIDSVPNGGDFDGPTGVMGAIEIVRTLNDAHIQTQHPIEVVVFTDEEGVRFKKGTLGSAAMAGVMPVEEVMELVDEEGISFREAIKAIKTDSPPSDVRLKKWEIKASIELHVEQSGNLERMNMPIGIVDAITGSAKLLVTVTGKADHAGATPMNLRSDALVPVAHMIQGVERIARSDPNASLVGTVGYVHVQPGAMNVVPGRVTFSVDMRDTSSSTLDWGVREVKGLINQAARSRGVQMEIEELEYVPAVQLSPTLRGVIADTCNKLKINYVDISSRAVHDTSNIGQVAEAAMIFVPSVGGKSHSPEELTHWNDIKVGLDVLYEVVLSLANK